MILNADARSIPLADQAVHCVVTSPPYWGLRDYGTATWEGGDPACPHRVPATGSTQNKGNNNREGAPFREGCGLCGARRVDAQLGLERTPEEYVAALVAVFREVWRVLRKDGTLWLNLGDSYANDTKWGGSSGGKHVPALHGQTGIGRQKVVTGLKAKDLVGIPWRVAFALQADGWYLRSDIIWSKPNPMPESVTDRPTKAHEYLFLLAKRERYYYDAAAIKEPTIWASDKREGHRIEYDGKRDGSNGQGQRAFVSIDKAGRNRRTVWEIATQPYPEAHFATFPEALVEPCVLAGAPEGGMVLDPFAGSGTVGLVCHRLGRSFVGMELKPDYCRLAYKRTAQLGLA